MRSSKLLMIVFRLAFDCVRYLINHELHLLIVRVLGNIELTNFSRFIDLFRKQCGLEMSVSMH